MPLDTLQAHPMSTYEVVSVLEQAFWILITAIGLYASFKQLQKVAISVAEAQTANLIASNGALVQVEMMLFANLSQIDLASAAMLRVEGRQELGEMVSPKEVSATSMERRSAIQNYLNSLDRLCAGVLRGVIPGDDARRDYSLVLDDAVKAYGKYIEDFERHFTNIIALRKQWRER